MLLKDITSHIYYCSPALGSKNEFGRERDKDSYFLSHTPFTSACLVDYKAVCHAPRSRGVFISWICSEVRNKPCLHIPVLLRYLLSPSSDGCSTYIKVQLL